MKQITNKTILKQEDRQYPIGGYAPGNYMCYCTICKAKFQGDKKAVQCEPCAIKMTKEEPKQETLKKASLQYRLSTNNKMGIEQVAFVNGAKWQAERMYSEEEVLDILDKFLTSIVKGEKTGLIEEWFEQHKKK